MTQTTQSTLLVTGASGHFGRRVVELLLEHGASAIIATTRSPEKLADLAARGVTVRAADFEDGAGLAKAFAGADRLLLISTDAVDDKGTRLRQHQNAVKAAAEAGVKHVVYTSLTNATDTPILLAPDHAGTEQALAASGLGWTSLRNNVYMETLPGSLARAAQMGKLFSAIGEGKIGYVAREDCAQAAAGALRADFDGQRTLDVTGPEAVAQADLARIASDLTGKPIEYVPLPLEVLIDNMVKAGLPRPVAAIYASFDSAGAQGKLDVVTHVVEELSGKQPTSIREFLTVHQAELTAS